MNTSQFMDKQIMEFSGLPGLQQQQQQQPQPQITEDKDDHSNNYSRAAAAATSDDDDGGGGSRMGLEEEIVPSYDFHQIRTPVVDPHPPPPPPLPPPPPITTPAASADSSSRNFGLPESHESSKFIREKENDTCDVAMLVEIDRAVKKHADNLLYSLEGISSRLSQLETRSRQLENSVDELKLTFGDNVGSTGGKLRQLEIILREVQTGMQVLHDNRESLEAQQPRKTQSTTSDHGYLHAAPPHSMPQPAATPQQPFQQPPQPSVPSQQHPTLPAPPAPPAANAPPTPPQQTIPPVQIPPSFPQTQIPSVPSLPGQQSFPQPSQPQEPTNQRCLATVQQSPPPLAQQHYQQPPPQQHYQVPPHLPPYSQPLPAQVQSPLPHNPEETSPYLPLPQQTYPPTSRPPSASLPSQQPPSVPHQQQFYRPSSRMYEMLVSRPGIGLVPYSTGYGTSLGPSLTESYNYSGSPSHYSSSSMNPPPFPSSVLPGGESNFPRLPTAKLLPQAMPVGSGSGGSGGNRVPIDDVVDKVATMGFSREQVRATVRKLTENGQSVDLNVVLDKLMNDGGNGLPRRDWKEGRRHSCTQKPSTNVDIMLKKQRTHHIHKYLKRRLEVQHQVNQE